MLMRPDDILAAFAAITVLGLLSLALTLPFEFWQTDPNRENR